VVQSVVVPLHDSVPIPDTVSVLLALSVYVLEVCVNTQPEGQLACTSDGQLKLPVQMAVEPDPVAVTLVPLPTTQLSLVVKLLPDNVISNVLAGYTVVPAPVHARVGTPFQILAKPVSRGTTGSVPPQLVIVNAATRTAAKRPRVSPPRRVRFASRPVCVVLAPPSSICRHGLTPKGYGPHGNMSRGHRAG
jgi:hypothetical protein